MNDEIICHILIFSLKVQLEVALNSNISVSVSIIYNIMLVFVLQHRSICQLTGTKRAPQLRPITFKIRR